MKKLYANSDIDSYSKIHSILGYKEVKRKKSIFRGLSFVTYEKEKDVPNYQALRDRYAPRSTIPFFFVVLFAVIAIGLATAYLIVNLTNKEADRMLLFLTLMLPTSISTLVATAISFIRYFNELKNIEKVAATRLLEKEVSQL